MNAASSPEPVRRGPGDFDAVGATDAVAAGRTSVAALVRDSRTRIEAWEPALGAVVSLLAPQPGAAIGRLAGVCIGVKDSISVADAVPAPNDATIVTRLADAGAVTVARLALAEPGAPGGLTPQTRNPRAWGRICGGSSGGSAAAVAAGLVHVALGADAGGSIRIPASCCGVAGLKPTRGLVPLTGVRSPTYTLDAVGPLAATVADLGLVLDVIAGYDAHDPSSILCPAVPRSASPDRLRVGVPVQTLRSRIDADVRAVWEGALGQLALGGATLEEVDLSLLDDMPTVAPMLGAAEAAAVLRDRSPHQRGSALPAVEDRLRRGERLAGSDVARAYRARELFQGQVREAFEEVDVLVTPTLACRVPPAGDGHHEVDLEVAGVREARVSALTRLLNPWNVAGVPAGTVPAGLDDNGAPVGVQVIGSWFSDDLVLEVMSQVELQSGGPWPAVSTADTPGARRRLRRRRS